MFTYVAISIVVVVIVLVLSLITITKGYAYKHSIDPLPDDNEVHKGHARNQEG